MEYDFIIDRETPEVVNLRVANFVLEWKFNPTANADYPEVTPSNQSNVDWYMEACGLIPDFFARAVDEWESENGSGCNTDDSRGDRPTLSEIAKRMDTIYGFGGFNRYAWPGTVLEDGTFESPAVDDDDDEQDPPLIPYVKLIHADEKHLECFVYPYGVVTLRDIKTGETKTARFD
jgi:hypothetical protein